MGKRREKLGSLRSSQTLPPSPSHSSSSSDFEFTTSISPRAAKSSSTLCPADELFYKGQLLPLHLSPRLSMVHDLLLASSRTSSSSDVTYATTASHRDSTGSSSNDDYSRSSFASTDSCEYSSSSCRPSSAAEDDEFKRLNNGSYVFPSPHQIKKNKYFSFSRFSSVFKKENNNKNNHHNSHENMAAASSSVKKISTTAKEVIRKYLKKVKPLYEKLSQKQQQQRMRETGASDPVSLISVKSADRSVVNEIEKMNNARNNNNPGFPLSFSGNLRYRRSRRSCVSSCPSSMRSSPSHSGMLSRNGVPVTGINTGRVSGGGGGVGGMSSSMEEFQSAIQGAIAHCKNSLLQNKTSLVISSDV